MKAKQSHQQHGLHALKRRLRVRGLAALDRRSATFRRAMEWRRELEADLGPQLTATRRTMLDLATMRMILLDAGFRWLVEQLEAKGGPGLINTRRRSIYPVAQQLDAIAATQDRAMERLGLDRVPVTTDTEQEIIRAVRGDLRRARRKSRIPRNEIPHLPHLAQDGREASGADDAPPSTVIAQPGLEAPTTPTP